MIANRGIREKIDHSQSPIIPLLAIIITTVQVVFLIWRFSSWYYDDPFITYRYAFNLIQGIGFVYNPGERVLSTTTPFFALLLAGFGTIWSDLPKVATLLGCLFTGLSGLFFWDLASQWKINIAGWVGLLLIPTFPLINSTISSETPLYIALVLGTLDCFVRRHYRSMAFLAALLILVRPDGALLSFIIVIYYLLGKNKRIPYSALGIFFIITALWFGFAWLYFGSPLPMTLITKQQQGLMSISQLFAPTFLKIVGSYTQKSLYSLEALLALIGLLWLVIHRHPSMVLLFWTAFYFLAYTLLGVTGYYWYYSPLVPGFIILVGAGFLSIHKLIKEIKWSWLSRFRFERILYIILSILWIYQGLDTYKYSQTPDSKYRIYRSIGEWLSNNTNDNDQVGTLETGIIGYYSERPIIDFAGIIQPEVAKQMRADSTYQDTARWAIGTYHPAYMVMNPKVFPALMEDFINQKCHLVQYFYKENYNSNQDMAIYHCK
jgi:hypothetical protein